jgi:hypothetical protein
VKELLRKFLADLLNEDTSAAQQAKDAGLKYIRGSRGLWSKSGEKPATHSTKDGKFVALAGPQPKKPATDTALARGQRAVDTARDSLTRDTPHHIPMRGEKPSTSKPTTKSKEFSELLRYSKPEGKEFLRVLETGDATQVQAEITRLGLYVTPAGKIKAGNLKGDKNVQKIFGGSKAMPARLNKLLSDLGLPILQATGIQKTEPDDDQPVVDSSVEYLKPSNTYEDRPAVNTSVDAVGVTIGDSRFHTLPIYEPNSSERAQLVVESDLKEIKNRNPNMSDEDAERKADEINGIVQTHNDRVRFLQAAIQRNEKFVDLGTGQEAVQLVSERLLNSIGSRLPERDRRTFEEAVKKLAAAETTEQFAQEWKQFLTVIKNIPELSKSGALPLICEHLTAMRNAIQGRHIIIPTSDSFKLGDIIAYNPQGVEQSDVRSMVDNLSLIEVGIDIGSVKRDAGASSVVGSRIYVTSYTDPTVAPDLAILGRAPEYEYHEVKDKNGEPERDKNGKPKRKKVVTDPGAFGEIYGATTEEQLEQVEDKFLTVIKNRMGDIRSYYRIPEEVSDEEIIAGLSSGSPPSYDSTGVFIRFGEKSGVFGKECPPPTPTPTSTPTSTPTPTPTPEPKGQPLSPLNTRQLGVYSLVGYAFEAIYNTNAAGQAFSNTTFKANKIEVSDGIAVMGKTKFQFQKNMECRKGVLKDEGIAAFIKPTPRSKMRTY